MGSIEDQLDYLQDHQNQHFKAWASFYSTCICLFCHSWNKIKYHICKLVLELLELYVPNKCNVDIF